jgi:hypothetical protein
MSTSWPYNRCRPGCAVGPLLFAWSSSSGVGVRRHDKLGERGFMRGPPVDLVVFEDPRFTLAAQRGGRANRMSLRRWRALTRPTVGVCGPLHLARL